MQVIEFENKSESPRKSQKKSTEQYLGITLELNDPFHLAIRLTDLNNNNKYAKIIVYSIGSKKEILWGTYEFKNKQITYESSCKYKISELSKFLKLWYSKNFETVSDIVLNRIKYVMLYMTDNTDKFINYDEYKILKYIQQYLQNKINYDTLEKNIDFSELQKILPKINIYPETNKYTEIDDIIDLEIDVDDLKQYLTTINKAITDYEETLNLSNIDNDVLNKIVINKDKIYEIIKTFHSDIQYGKFNTNSFYNALHSCLSESDCKKVGFYPDVCSLYDFISDINFE